MNLARLNLGCGANPVTSDMINVDLVALPGVDVVADLDQPWPFADKTVGYIVASHVFEHLANPVRFVREAWRILADSGVLDIRVPWWQHRNSYTDPTHRRHCTEQTFDYWIPGEGLHIGYGLAYGSPPACFTYLARRLNGDEQSELQVVLRKLDDA